MLHTSRKQASRACSSCVILSSTSAILVAFVAPLWGTRNAQKKSQAKKRGTATSGKRKGRVIIFFIVFGGPRPTSKRRRELETRQERGQERGQERELARGEPRHGVYVTCAQEQLQPNCLRASRLFRLESKRYRMLHLGAGVMPHLTPVHRKRGEKERGTVCGSSAIL